MTCQTCKHWETIGPESTEGDCLKVVYNPHGERSGQAWLEGWSEQVSTMEAHLRTTREFGCVLHSAQPQEDSRAAAQPQPQEDSREGYSRKVRTGRPYNSREAADSR